MAVSVLGKLLTEITYEGEKHSARFVKFSRTCLQLSDNGLKDTSKTVLS